MENLKVLASIFRSNNALRLFALPALIYWLMNRYFGLAEATIVLALYGVVVDFYYKDFGKLVYLFAFMGLLELVFAWVIPEQRLANALALKSTVELLPAMIVQLVFMARLQPLPMLVAEAFSPELADFRSKFPTETVRVWLKLNVLLIALILMKAAVLLYLSEQTDQLFAMGKMLLGWPFNIAILYLMIAYSSKNLYQKYSLQ